MTILLTPPPEWSWYDSRVGPGNYGARMDPRKATHAIAGQSGMYGFFDYSWDIIKPCGGYIKLISAQREQTPDHPYNELPIIRVMIAFDDEATAALFRLTHL